MLEMKDVDDKSEILATDLILFVTNIVGVQYLELTTPSLWLKVLINQYRYGESDVASILETDKI